MTEVWDEEKLILIFDSKDKIRYGDAVDTYLFGENTDHTLKATITTKLQQVIKGYEAFFTDYKKQIEYQIDCWENSDYKPILDNIRNMNVNTYQKQLQANITEANADLLFLTTHLARGILVDILNHAVKEVVEGSNIENKIDVICRLDKPYLGMWIKAEDRAFDCIRVTEFMYQYPYQDVCQADDKDMTQIFSYIDGTTTKVDDDVRKYDEKVFNLYRYKEHDFLLFSYETLRIIKQFLVFELKEWI